LVRASQRTGAGPSKDILNSDDSVASARPYGEAVQSNVVYGTLSQVESGQGAEPENRNTGGSMSIELEESVDAKAIGLDNDKSAESRQALAIIVPT
jgi:hypothetical protein